MGHMSPIDYSKYPPEWHAISRDIRTNRAENRCECSGECGLHHDRRCEEVNGEPAKWARGKVILTVAHLNHDPMDCRPENLKAMCQRCHLRYDVEHHKASARKRRHRLQVPLLSALLALTLTACTAREAPSGATVAESVLPSPPCQPSPSGAAKKRSP